MPLKIVRPDHYEIVGTRSVMLTTPHATALGADLYMGQIVEEAALLSKAFAVIGKVSKDFSDANRIQSAKVELRNGLQTYVDEYGVKFILEIRGRKDSGINIATEKGESASKATSDILRGTLARHFKVAVDSHSNGSETGSISAGFRRKYSSGSFVVEVVRIDFGPDERTLQRAAVVTDVADLVGALNLSLSLVADESRGSGLD